MYLFIAILGIVSIFFFGLFLGAFGGDKILAGVSFVLGFFNIVLSCSVMGGEESTSINIFSIILFLINIAIVIYRFKVSADQQRIIEAQKLKNYKINFYERCEKNGIKNCNSEKNIAKAQLIASEMGFGVIEDIVEFYKECKELKCGREEEIEKERIEEIVKEEARQKDKLEEYAFFVGRDKRVAILEAERDYHLYKAGLIKEGQLQLVRDSQQRETDWAIHGGIASGLAGGAAGVATAMDIQSKNAAIRAQNQENLSALAPTILAGLEAQREHKSKAEDLENQISEAKTKLISDMSVEELFEKLVVTSKRLSVSDSGTVTVNMWISKPEELMIFDDVPAIIDGTIIANIFDGEEKIGSCYMVLPTYGVDKKKEKITGMCLTCGKKGEKYTVEFEALHLWAMER